MERYKAVVPQENQNFYSSCKINFLIKSSEMVIVLKCLFIKFYPHILCQEKFG